MKYSQSKNLLVLNVIWTKIAEKKLEEINKYLLDNFGQKTVDEFQVKLISSADLISQNNEIGKRVREDLRVFLVVKQISIVYTVSSEIEILTLWDNRQKPIW